MFLSCESSTIQVNFLGDSVQCKLWEQGNFYMLGANEGIQF